jgi:2,3-bisphosphoglycerate-independent phosphoglycerate mutase
MDAEQICDDDAVFFLNFRSDRARQMTQALMVSLDSEEAKKYPTRNPDFVLKNLRNVYIATMTKYYKEYTGPVFLDEQDIKHTLGEVISQSELRQLHVAETEKFAHVTKFFNGDKQIVYPGEKDILVPSHKVATYDLDPEMSAQEIYDQVIAHGKDYDALIINFANGDMVGHTGIIPAAIRAVEKMDDLVGKLIIWAKEAGFELLITADHGNCEEMGTPEAPMTAHTLNPVPFWYIVDGEVKKTLSKGGLADIAPTMLQLLGIAVPKEMTGKNLIG